MHGLVLGIIVAPDGLVGSFCECAQPMRDDATLQRSLSLAGHIHKMIPDGLVLLAGVCLPDKIL